MITCVTFPSALPNPTRAHTKKQPCFLVQSPLVAQFTKDTCLALCLVYVEGALLNLSYSGGNVASHTWSLLISITAPLATTCQHPTSACLKRSRMASNIQNSLLVLLHMVVTFASLSVCVCVCVCVLVCCVWSV